MSQRCPPVLSELVRRAAEMTKPFNAQDAVLIIKSLNTLRVPSAATRVIGEKAAFALASAPSGSVPPEVVVDTVNALTSLQVHTAPIVHDVLTRRFRELSTSPAQTIQKAALCLMKMGTKHAPPAVCNTVLHALHMCLQRHPQDRGLQLAYVGLFPYSSLRGETMVLVASTRRIRASMRTLLECAQRLTGDEQGVTPLRALRGNAAWQAMHLYVALAHVERVSASSQASTSDVLRTYLREWALVRRRAVGSVDTAGFPFARYASFVAQFESALGPLMLPVLHPLVERPQQRFFANATQYDVAKLTVALAAHFREAAQNDEEEEGERDGGAAMSAVCRAVLHHAVAFAHERGGDMMTLAGVWQLAAVTAHLQILAASDLASLCTASEAQLRGGPGGDTAASYPSQVAWVLSSVARLSRSQPREPLLHALIGCLVGRLTMTGLPSTSNQSLAQLWHSAGLLAGTAQSFPPALVTPLASAIAKRKGAKLGPADVGMLLSGSEMIMRPLKNEGDAQPIADAVQQVLRKALCDAEVPATSLQPHGPVIRHGASLLERAGISITDMSPTVSALLRESRSEADLREPLDAAAAWVLLSSTRQLRGDDLSACDAVLKRVCLESRRWAAQLTWPSSTNVTAVLKCAEVCQRNGCALSFSSLTELPSEKLFVIPVDRCVLASTSCPSPLPTGAAALSKTDAAHMVRLMGDAFHRTGALPGAADENVARLVDFALSMRAEEASVPGLLFLLHANHHLSVSSRLFSKTQLVVLLHLTEAKLCRLAAEVDDPHAVVKASQDSRQGPLSPFLRLSRALLNSQILPRLGEQALDDRAAFRRSMQVAVRCVEQEPTFAERDFLLKAHLLLDA